MKENKILGPETLATSINIGDDKCIVVNNEGTQFNVFKNSSILYTCKLKLTMSEQFIAKFRYITPFEEIIFDCTDDVIWKAIIWILNRETRELMENNNNEIS